ncbi:MAG: hypothetical protein Q9191_002938 [Dirinaria sp. TL-2023a]
MAIARDQAYSSLEVIPQQFTPYTSQKEKFVTADLEKEAVPDDGKQVSSKQGEEVTPENGKQCALNSDGTEKIIKGDLDTHENSSNHFPRHRSWKTKRLLLIGAVFLIVILAAVLGGVLGTRHGTRHKSSSTASPEVPSNTSNTSSAVPSQRNIAALSFALNSVNNTRLYFQDDVGQIMEAGNSDTNTTWSVRGTGINGKNGSTIAAAVSRPGFPLAISVFYLNGSDVIHDVSYTPSTGWTPGRLADQGYTAMPNASLSAMYNQCRLCANTTIIAFQDKNGFVQIGNLTSLGWNLVQLGPGLAPQIGTALALQPFYRSGLEDQINLYYQKSNLNMSLATWQLAVPGICVDGWRLSAQIYHAIPSGSPIAAASSYSNVSTGFETWIEVLSLSDRGIEVNTWSGAINAWAQQYVHPSVMVNSTNIKGAFEDVAVTATGNAFGVLKQQGHADTIQHWLVEDDTVNWNLLGTVDLGGVWG